MYAAFRRLLLTYLLTYELESVGKGWTAADAPGAARATTGAPSSAVASRYSSIATAGIATHGALHGPRSCGLVRRHRTPDTAQPDAPCATCNSRCSYLSPPPFFHAARPGSYAWQHRVVARPQPHACGRLVSQMARPLGAMHSPTITDSGSQHVPSLLCHWNLLSCRSPPP